MRPRAKAALTGVGFSMSSMAPTHPLWRARMRAHAHARGREVIDQPSATDARGAAA
jgi:hypothetical protein